MLRALAEAVYPRGGWSRAFEYVKHRVRRLPDTPEKIARGIAAGVFASWTPFYGFHFIIAVLGAVLLRGNVIASLLGTFFGNPLTYVPIGVVALNTGHFILGSRVRGDIESSLMGKFAGAGRDLWHNLTTIFTPETADWHRLGIFYDEVFLPYLVGGIVPGLIASAVMYYLSLSLVGAYQKRRRKALRAKLDVLKKNPRGPADGGPHAG